MGYFFCAGNYAHEIIERCNTVQAWGKTDQNPRGTFALRPGNTTHSYTVTNIDNQYKLRINGLTTLPSPTGSSRVSPITLAGLMGAWNIKSETPVRAAQCVVTVQTVREWKRTLTNLLVSPDGFTGVPDFESNSTLVGNRSGRSYVTTTHNGGTDNKIIGTSIYDTDIYDDYLIALSINYYDEDKNKVNNIYNCVQGQITPYRYYDTVFATWRVANADSLNLNLTPDVIIYGNYNKSERGEWLGINNRISMIGGSSTGVVELHDAISPLAPYTLLYITRPNTSATYTGGGLLNGFYVTPAYHCYIFPDFRSIQTWYLDWGIQAYETVADLQNDIFPDDLEPDIGFDDNQNPNNIDYLPDNKGDPTDFTPPDLLPESAYDLYALSFANFVTFKQKVLSQDFWDNIIKFFTNPLESILSIALFPFDFQSHDGSSLSQSDSVDIINYTVENVPCYKFLPKYSFYNFDLGTCNVRAYYGNYLDYQATYSLYVPYCGTLSLDASLVVNHTIYLRCSISALTGAGTVYVTNELGRLLGTLSGNFGNTLTFSSNNFASTLANALFNSIPKSLASFASPTVLFETGSKFAEEFFTTPQHNQLHGQIAGNAAFGGVTTPFIQVTLPIPTQAGNYERIKGINSQYYTQVGSIPADTFVSYEDIIVNIPCAEAEKDMIYNLLKTGIII